MTEAGDVRRIRRSRRRNPHGSVPSHTSCDAAWATRVTICIWDQNPIQVTTQRGLFASQPAYENRPLYRLRRNTDRLRREPHNGLGNIANPVAREDPCGGTSGIGRTSATGGASRTSGIGGIGKTAGPTQPDSGCTPERPLSRRRRSSRRRRAAPRVRRRCARASSRRSSP